MALILPVVLSQYPFQNSNPSGVPIYGNQQLQQVLSPYGNNAAAPEVSFFFGLSAILTETVPISESIAEQAAFKPHLNETVSLSESISEMAAFYWYLSETVSTSESIHVQLRDIVPLSEMTSLYEMMTAQTSDHVSISEPVPISEAIHQMATLNWYLTETVTESEAIHVSAGASYSLSELVTLTEANTPYAGDYQSLNESMSVVENFLAEFYANQGLSETEMITESISVIFEHLNNIHLNESVPITESIAITRGYTVPILETIEVLDSVGTCTNRRPYTDKEAREFDYIWYTLTTQRGWAHTTPISNGRRLQSIDYLNKLADKTQVPSPAEHITVDSTTDPTEISAVIKTSVLTPGSFFDALVSLPDGTTIGAQKSITARGMRGSNSILIVPQHFEPGLTNITLSSEYDSCNLEWDGTYWLLMSLSGSATAS